MTEIAASSPAPGSSRSARSAGISRLLPDDLLVGRATKGDRRAFEEIFQRYHQDLYRFCLAMVGNPQDAQDALQETMVKVLRALPGEKRHIQLKPWLYRIARNEAVETIRRRRDSVEIEPELTASTVELAETAEDRERLRKLFADLEELPDRQRAALVMRELAGLRFAQIGAAFDTSAAVARQTVYEARLSLRQMEAGREMSCEAVTRELSDGDGRITRRREVRAHLRSCPSCRAFRDGMAERHRDLAAIAPLPLALSAGLLHGVFGSQASAAVGGGAAGAGGGAAVGASGSGIAGTVGAGAGKAIATSAIVKSAAAIAVAAVVGASTADRSGLIDLPLPGGGGKAAETGTRPPSAGISTPQQGSAPGAGARAGGRQDSKGLGKRNPESTAGAGRHGRSRAAAAAQHPVRPHRHHASQAERHGKPAGLPAASSHGQQAAAAHKPPQANASPGGGGRKSAPKVTPPPSQPSPPAKGKEAETPPASSEAESPGPGTSGGGAHGASGDETLEP
jgi:RNA polymerase sigma factor (sigma-70 family)